MTAVLWMSRRVAERLGMRDRARWLKSMWTFLVDRRTRGALRTFQREHAGVLARVMVAGDRGRGKALIVSFGLYGLPVEIFLVKGLERAGYRPVVLTDGNPWVERYYKLAGVDRILRWDGFVKPLDSAIIRDALGRAKTFTDLMALSHGGVRIGKYAAATGFRSLRIGSLDFNREADRERIVPFVKRSMEAAEGARRIMREVNPDIALSLDIGYTPRGELFDVCLASGVDTITWHAAHKSNTLIPKRYRKENADVHPASLSAGSWSSTKAIPWTVARRSRLMQELRDTYASGEWYSEVGTQFDKRLFAADELRRKLGLDPLKKTVVIFPHIVWDGTFFYGSDLFSTYEEWLVETVRAACGNDRVNWLVKIHPANVVKNARDGVSGEAGEVRIIREQIGRLPDHVRLIPAENDINTFSLFGLMDYCVTVRGTIGLEAAVFGIPTLTAGTGRYDRLGFTIDSEERKTYLDRLGRIQDLPRLSDEQRKLAERYAYGTFIARPFPLSTVTYEHKRDAKATLSCRIKARTREDWLNAPDLNVFAEWVLSGEEDFLSEDIGRQAGAGAESLSEEGART